MKKKIKCRINAIAIIFSSTQFFPAAIAGDRDIQNSQAFRLETGTGFKFGNLNYQIGGDISATFKLGPYAGTTQTGATYMPLSELLYPINVPTARFMFAYNFLNRFDFELESERNYIGKAFGKMQDSDWINSPTSLDIYSESDLWANIQQYDAEFGMRTQRRGVINKGRIGLGIRVLRYRFKTYNTYQTYPSTGASPIFLGGQTLAYSFDALIPYASIAHTFDPLPTINIQTKLKFTPFASTRDKDEHLLRDVVSLGETEGMFFEISVYAANHISNHWYLTANLNYSLLSTHGHEIQTHNAPTDELSTAIIGLQHAITQINLIFGIKFEY